MKRGKSASALLALMAIGMNFNGFAQEDPLLSETDSVVNTDQIDIEGLYKKKKQPSQADKIQALRRKLEAQHEQMMRKKIEDMRLEEERKLARKLQNALNGQMQAMDQVSTSYAAPMKVQAPAPAPVKVEAEKKNSVTVSGGFMNIASELNDLDANFNMKLAAESKVHPRIAIGVSFRYVDINMNDEQNTYLTNSNFFSSNVSYNNQYQNGREISYKQMSFGAHGKFFFAVDSKIKPFAGAGIAYNRGSFKYDQNENFTSNGFNYGDEKVGANNVAGNIGAGAVVQFSPMFSAELAVNYEKALTSGVAESDNNSSPDEQRLRNLAKDIEEADVVSVNVGLSLHF
jgi:outer membrane protein W